MTNKNEQATGAPLNGPDMAGSNQVTEPEKSQTALTEEAVLSFWQENKIFEKSLEKNLPENNPQSKGEYVFYDGPPFATGTPHYGHLLAGTMKDLIPRYKTMNGYVVPRKWGWDCHGLPIESLIQKENNLKTKIDIEEFGIKKFSQAAKASVFRYDAVWRKTVPRIGRFVDMDNQYTTMDSDFMESVWWSFGELYKKGLIYEDFKVMHISPLLETPLSNSEVSQNYKDITDISAYVKFELVDEPRTFLIAWTTTPWTLPGNVALAVGAEIEYVKIKITSGDNAGESYIVAKGKLADTLKNAAALDKSGQGEPTYEATYLKGADLIGKKYKPLFDYYAKDQKLENRENGWKVYNADFVTTEDGTGIVHIAPAFGEDDLNLGKAYKMPFVQHVNMDGTIKAEATDFAGMQAKPKATDENPNAHQNTDIEVIKYLAHHGTLFAKEKMIHPYPHCERTHAPLLNYALSSWFVKVTNLRQKMVELNKKITWVPESIGSKRFGNWLENAKDWGISRSRYWGTTMPIWRAEDGEIDVINSVSELKKRTKSTNTYFLARHGQAEHNVGKFLSSDNSVKSELTEQGVKEVEALAEKLLQSLEKENKKIDFIFCSPLLRTKHTAEIVAEKIGFNKSQIIIEDRLKETQSGVLNGKSRDEYSKIVKNVEGQFYQAPEGGETLVQIKKRVGDFIYEIDKKYQDKNILIVTHEYPVWMLHAIREGMDNKKAAINKSFEQYFVQTGHFEKFDFAPIPHDDEYILDLHRPYIDEIKYQKNGKKFTRIPEVFDTWFDSGSMPYAVPHFPFSENDNLEKSGFLNKIFKNFTNQKQPKHFPADFIAEGLDQTRGWFYTLMVLNTALFGKAPFKNVIVNGLALAEDGRKMSKSLNNYPDPVDILNKYGADALRYYMLSSQIVKAEPLNFSEKGVDEVTKKVINRLMNVVSFYELYVTDNESQKLFETYSKDLKKIPASQNILDEWILSRLYQTLEKVTDSLEKYELDVACRPIADFIDDLSTWYLRRSRDRFKGDDSKDVEQVKEVMHFVLIVLAKIMAPFMPFMAEEVYQRVSGTKMINPNLSVHLEDWPKSNGFNKEIIDSMEKVRNIVTLGFEARDKIKIRVRQPLQTLKLSEDMKLSEDVSKINEQAIELIKDEVNVKEVIFEKTDSPVSISSEITPELLEEGVAREIIRLIQSLRKKGNLNPEDKIDLIIGTDDDGQKLINKFADQIKKPTNIINFEFAENDGEVLSADKYSFKVLIK